MITIYGTAAGNLCDCEGSCEGHEVSAARGAVATMALLRVRLGVIERALRETSAKLLSAANVEKEFDLDGLARALGRLEGIAQWEAERIGRLAEMLAEDIAGLRP